MNEVFKSIVSNTGIDITDYTLAADTEDFPQRYIVYVEGDCLGDMEKLRDLIEEKLFFYNFSYAEKVRNGKLGKLELRRLKKGTYVKYRTAVAKRGASPNQIKPFRVADTDEKREFLLRNCEN